MQKLEFLFTLWFELNLLYNLVILFPDDEKMGRFFCDSICYSVVFLHQITETLACHYQPDHPFLVFWFGFLLVLRSFPTFFLHHFKYAIDWGGFLLLGGGLMRGSCFLNLGGWSFCKGRGCRHGKEGGY